MISMISMNERKVTNMRRKKLKVTPMTSDLQHRAMKASSKPRRQPLKPIRIAQHR